ncbi:hypothetical protein D3C85_1521040 [compost metagenome]
MVNELKVYPEGSKSVTSTPLVFCGPLLFTIISKVTGVPIKVFVLFTVFVNDKSAANPVGTVVTAA